MNTYLIILFDSSSDIDDNFMRQLSVFKDISKYDTW